MVGHGGSSSGSYLADPTSPIPSHCSSIATTSTLRVNVLIFSLLFQRDKTTWPRHIVVIIQMIECSANEHLITSMWRFIILHLFSFITVLFHKDCSSVSGIHWGFSILKTEEQSLRNRTVTKCRKNNFTHMHDWSFMISINDFNGRSSGKTECVVCKNPFNLAPFITAEVNRNGQLARWTKIPFT